MELVNIGETDVNSETKNIASPIQEKILLHDVNSVKLFYVPTGKVLVPGEKSVESCQISCDSSLSSLLGPLHEPSSNNANPSLAED